MSGDLRRSCLARDNTNVGGHVIGLMHLSK